MLENRNERAGSKYGHLECIETPLKLTQNSLITVSIDVNIESEPSNTDGNIHSSPIPGCIVLVIVGGLEGVVRVPELTENLVDLHGLASLR